MGNKESADGIDGDLGRILQFPRQILTTISADDSGRLIHEPADAHFLQDCHAAAIQVLRADPTHPKLREVEASLRRSAASIEVQAAAFESLQLASATLELAAMFEREADWLASQLPPLPDPISFPIR